MYTGRFATSIHNGRYQYINWNLTCVPLIPDRDDVSSHKNIRTPRRNPIPAFLVSKNFNPDLPVRKNSIPAESVTGI